MRKLFCAQNIPLIAFITIELLLWLFISFSFVFVSIDVRGFEYAAVCLAFVASFVIIRKVKIIHLAFFFIVLADLFLTVLGSNYLVPGVSLFICATLTIGTGIYLKSKKEFKTPSLIIRAVLTVIALTVSLLLPNTNAVLVLSFVYGVNLLFNTVCAFLVEKRNWLFIVGLICFVLCDIFVALSASREMGLISGSGFFFDLLTGYKFNFAWFFYVPCLTLLPISYTKAS